MKSRDARTGQVTKALQVIAWVVCVCFSVKIVLCSRGRRVSGVCVVGIKVRVGSWNSVCVPWPHPQRVLWRCPTLPHPPRCSTIGACGLSFQVRNGCWAFPRGYDHHKWFNQYSIVPRWGFVLVVIRIVATSNSVVPVNPFAAFQPFVCG